jgi:hypothetical protein
VCIRDNFHSKRNQSNFLWRIHHSELCDSLIYVDFVFWEKQSIHQNIVWCGSSFCQKSLRNSSEFHNWIRRFSSVFQSDSTNLESLKVNNYHSRNIVHNILCWTTKWSLKWIIQLFVIAGHIHHFNTVYLCRCFCLCFLIRNNSITCMGFHETMQYQNGKEITSMNAKPNSHLHLNWRR